MEVVGAADERAGDEIGGGSRAFLNETAADVDPAAGLDADDAFVGEGAHAVTGAGKDRAAREAEAAAIFLQREESGEHPIGAASDTFPALRSESVRVASSSSAPVVAPSPSTVPRVVAARAALAPMALKYAPSIYSEPATSHVPPMSVSRVALAAPGETRVSGAAPGAAVFMVFSRMRRVPPAGTAMVPLLENMMLSTKSACARDIHCAVVAQAGGGVEPVGGTVQCQGAGVRINHGWIEVADVKDGAGERAVVRRDRSAAGREETAAGHVGRVLDFQHAAHAGGAEVADVIGERLPGIPCGARIE